MFRKSTEQQIIIEADKVASMKESLDALSWDRVAEIGKLLQTRSSEEEYGELGRELVAIAQANTSLFGKLGVKTTSFTGELMPSGVELLRNEEIVATPSSQGSSFSAGDSSEQVVEPQKTQFEDDQRMECSEGAQESVQYENAQKQPQAETNQEAAQILAQQQGSLFDSSDETDEISKSVRSILFPISKPTTVIPDIASAESDFFQVPEPSIDTFIPRGRVELTVVDPIKKSAHHALFKSVIWITKEQPGTQSTIAAKVQPQEETQANFVAESSPQPETLSVATETTAQSALDVLQDDKLMKEFGIEPEVRAALIKEVEDDLTKETVKPPLAKVSFPDVFEEDVFQFIQEGQSSSSKPSDTSDQVSSHLRQGSDIPPLEASSQLNFEVHEAVEDDNSDLKVSQEQIFSGRDNNDTRDLKRKVRDSRKQERLAGLIQKRESDHERFRLKAKKIDQKDLAGFKQIYASRDGALLLYLDSTGHVVAVDSARLV